MAKTIGPLLSFGASGQIGKSIVYATWKGIKDARQYVIPANPNTTAQQETRNCFRWVHDAYKYLPSVVQESWIAYAKGQKFTPANAWMTANLPVLRGQTDNSLIVFSKPVLGGIAPATASGTAGATKITVAATAQTLISGWTITEMIAACMHQEAPSGEHEAVICYAATDTTSPYSVDVTGLTTGQVYVWGAWFKYLRPDGNAAYGSAITGTATPT